MKNFDKNLLDSDYLIDKLNEILNQDRHLIYYVKIGIDYEENEYLGYDIEFVVKTNLSTWEDELAFEVEVDFDVENDDISEKHILNEMIDNIANEIEDVGQYLLNLSSDILFARRSYKDRNEII